GSVTARISLILENTRGHRPRLQVGQSPYCCPGLRPAGSRISSRYFFSSEGAHTSSRMTSLGVHLRVAGPITQGFVYVAGSVRVIVTLIVLWFARGYPPSVFGSSPHG